MGKLKIVALVVLLMATGCLPIPVKMSKVVRSPAGESADHTFIIEGKTSAHEVAQRLGWADVGLRDDRVFWARWAASTKGVATQILIPGAGINTTPQRWWTLHNLLVEFDNNGTVVFAREVDERHVLRELIARANLRGREFPNSRLGQPLNASADHQKHTGWLSVQDDRLNIRDRWAQADFKISRSSIERLEFSRSIPSDPTYPAFVLKLKDKTVWGKKIDLTIPPASLLPTLKALMPGQL
jgi:hypothetical protein